MSEDYPQREADQIEGVPPPEYQRAVVGHAAVLADLRNRLAAGRLPGGILLHGPLGIGKATLAFEMAREIFTATGDESPEHVVEQVAAGGYPNLFVLRKAPRETGRGFYTVIRVDEVRGFVEELRMTRGRAGHRVAIVDAIDDANANAANALLKILEEPPADTTFLLISHRPGQLLPTIKSRCHPIALRPLGDAEVREVLVANRPEAGAEAIDRAVSLAGGSPRRGFEALLIGDAGALTALKDWLADPARPAASAHLRLADALGASRDSAEARFGRDILLQWVAEEAKSAAVAGVRSRLASANELWEKAVALFADTDEYNLDARQTLVTILDAIKRHALTTTSPQPAEPT
jgi:DNA polymerase III subunit delta'